VDVAHLVHAGEVVTSNTWSWAPAEGSFRGSTAMTRRSLMMLSAITATTLSLSSATSVHAQKVVHPAGGTAGEWRLIGTTEADHAADHDGIVVKGPFDNFRRIKFKVTDAPLNMQRLVVTYDNGEPDRIDVRQNISQGGESRQIDLKGIGKRSVRRIDFWYDTKGFLKGKAKVTVFGMK
jgi:hypothetical protein